MTLEELYAQIGGDYAEAIGRLRMEKLIDRFILKFLDDPASNALIESWAAGDDRAAFDAAHTVKGVCANLALPRLAGPADKITEALREGNDALRASTDIDALIAEFTAEYKMTIEGIEAYKASK